MIPSFRPLVGWSVGWLVSRSVIISYKGGKFHFHAPIGAFIAVMATYQPINISIQYSLPTFMSSVFIYMCLSSGCKAEEGPEEDEGAAAGRPASRREEPERWNQ